MFPNFTSKSKFNFFPTSTSIPPASTSTPQLQQTLPASASITAHLAIVHNIADAAIKLLLSDARRVGGVGIATTQLQQSVDVEEGILPRGSLLDAARWGVDLHVLLGAHRATVVHNQFHLLHTASKHTPSATLHHLNPVTDPSAQHTHTHHQQHCSTSPTPPPQPSTHQLNTHTPSSTLHHLNPVTDPSAQHTHTLSSILHHLTSGHHSSAQHTHTHSHQHCTTSHPAITHQLNTHTLASTLHHLTSGHNSSAQHTHTLASTLHHLTSGHQLVSSTHTPSATLHHLTSGHQHSTTSHPAITHQLNTHTHSHQHSTTSHPAINTPPPHIRPSTRQLNTHTLSNTPPPHIRPSKLHHLTSGHQLISSTHTHWPCQSVWCQSDATCHQTAVAWWQPPSCPAHPRSRSTCPCRGWS